MRKKILIIDDDKMMCDLITEFLGERGGYEVSSATNGKDGLRTAIKLQPHLIILDIMMPGIDGLEVLKKLKKDEKTVKIPVVMLTGVSDSSIKHECSRLYDEMYLEKPVELAVLKTKIEEVLKWDGIT